MPRVVHVAGDRKLLVRGADRAGHESRPVGRLAAHLVGRPTRQCDRGQIQLAHPIGELEIGHRHAGGAERVGLDDVGPGLQILPMDLVDRLGLGECQDVNEILQVFRVMRQRSATEVGLVEFQRVNHRAHRTVEHQDALS